MYCHSRAEIDIAPKIAVVYSIISIVLIFDIANGGDIFRFVLGGVIEGSWNRFATV